LADFLAPVKQPGYATHMHSGVFRDAIVVVNEAASASVDHVLLGSTNRIHVLAGGCACCEGRQELLRLLCELGASARISETSEIRRIVLETSGLADLQAILAAIASDQARRQISCADCLIVAKADAVESQDVERVLDAMQSLNPTAVRFGAVRGVEAPLPDVEASVSIEQREPPNDQDVDPVFPSEIRLGDATWPAFAVWLSALLHARGNELLRIKGVVHAPTGRLLIQAVRRQVQPPERLPGPIDEADGTLVVFGRGYSSEILQGSLDAFADAARKASI
jgi:G3E family GTPase